MWVNQIPRTPFNTRFHKSIRDIHGVMQIHAFTIYIPARGKTHFQKLNNIRMRNIQISCITCSTCRSLRKCQHIRIYTFKERDRPRRLFRYRTNRTPICPYTAALHWKPTKFRGMIDKRIKIIFDVHQITRNRKSLPWLPRSGSIRNDRGCEHKP